MNGYINGVQQITFADSGSLGTFSGPNNIIWFLQDEGNQSIPGEYAKGSIDFIRIYNSAETPGAYIVGQGLASGVPEPGSLTLFGGGIAAIYFARRRRK